MSENRVCLGIIVGVHGIRGEVKVKSFTTIDTDIANYGLLADKSDKQQFSLKVVGRSKDLLRVKLKGIDDRTIAEALKGTELYANRDILPQVDSEDEFYEADLIGLEVLDTNKNEVAKVVGFYNFGAGDILEIKLLDGKTEMLPFNDSYILEVNLDDAYIIVSSSSIVFSDVKVEEDAQS